MHSVIRAGAGQIIDLKCLACSHSFKKKADGRAIYIHADQRVDITSSN